MRKIDELFADAAAALDDSRRAARRAEGRVRELAGELGVELEEDAHPALRRAEEAVLALAIAANRKLAPVDLVDVGGPRRRPVPRAPYCAATYVPVRQTCPSSCPFRGHGCMAEAGYTGRAVRRLEGAAEGLDVYELARQEARAIDRLRPRRDGGRDGRSPRDLRLHVSGDVTRPDALEMIAAAALRWQRRGGGGVWTFTHAWRALERRLWTPISVLASVESPADAEHARDLGYTPAITVRAFPARSSFHLEGSTTAWIPCPAETSGRTCVECRLCIDREPWLHETGRGIAFAVHGMSAERARRRLPVLRRTA